MLRTLAALLLGKSIFFISRLFKLGGGFAAPGLYALKIDPDLISKLISHKAKNILITGTNGKTTTSRLISNFLQALNVKVVHNSSGSNLERGITSYLVKHSNLAGKLDYDFGVWEADEFAFNTIALKIKPDVIILLNVSRDQLDRYGEVNSVVNRWKKTLSQLDNNLTLIINQDDQNLVDLVSDFKGKIITFGISDLKIEGDIKTRSLKKPDFQALISKENLRSHLKGGKLNTSLENTHFKVLFEEMSEEFNLPLPGIYNIYNFLAAFALTRSFKINIALINSTLKKFSPAFGRYEQIRTNSTIVNFFLIKNPSGATQVLETILPHITASDTLLIALNDNFADGRDVSWIWDIKFENFKIQNSKFKIVVSGTRAYDMALRLKYAGVKQNSIEITPDLETAFEDASAKTSGRLFILPTYTALLQLQKIMVKKGIKKEYWKE